MLLIDDGFEQLLGAHTPACLEAELGSVIGLWPDGRIALLNSAWRRFAEQNHGAEALARWPIGSSLLLGISGELREHYARAFARVHAEGKPWEQYYQCHTSTLGQYFCFRVLPLRARALLLIHSSVVDGPQLARLRREDEAVNALEPTLSDYRAPGGLIRQCSNCRRTQRIDSSQWDWVPRFVERPPPNITHGICPLCLRQDYPDFVRAEAEEMLSIDLTTDSVARGASR